MCVCAHTRYTYIESTCAWGIDTGLLIIPVDILTTPLPNIDLALAPRDQMPAANA